MSPGSGKGATVSTFPEVIIIRHTEGGIEADVSHMDTRI